VDGQQILMIVDKHDDILVFHAAQQPLEVASPLEGRTQSNLYLLAGMPGELIQREQRPVHARRRHLQGVLDADRVLDIEHPADLTADLLAIIDQDAIGMIDVDAQDRMLALRQKFDTPALIAERLYDRGQHSLQLIKPARHLNPLECSTNKKWAKRPSLKATSVWPN